MESVRLPKARIDSIPIEFPLNVIGLAYEVRKVGSHEGMAINRGMGGRQRRLDHCPGHF